jgi:mono/diheme cytochrome c family protein
VATLVSADTLQPGESGEIKVSLNPAGKFGEVTKVVTIISNDQAHPQLDVELHAVVEHGADGAPSEPLEDILFAGECARCHADPAATLTGAPLYSAICGMCHGELQEYAASLEPGVAEREALRAWIADGQGDTGMPGYSEAMGGPLTEEQIDMLVETLLVARTRS